MMQPVSWWSQERSGLLDLTPPEAASHSHFSYSPQSEKQYLVDLYTHASLYLNHIVI